LPSLRALKKPFSHGSLCRPGDRGMNPKGRLITALFWRLMASPKQPLIWIIDSNHWERVNLRAVLIERGCEVEGFVSIFHAVVMLYREIVEKPAAIVLEIKNLAYQSLELDELARIGAPIILLTGVYEDMKLADEHKWAAVLRRPFTIGQVAQTVERLVGQGSR
jgi:FixJ family two-component response regulator